MTPATLRASLGLTENAANTPERASMIRTMVAGELLLFLAIGLCVPASGAQAQNDVRMLTSADCRRMGWRPDSAITSRQNPDPVRPCHPPLPANLTPKPKPFVSHCTAGRAGCAASAR
jgi:hypothetical protein